MAKKSEDHVIITTLDSYLNCLHCGERYAYGNALPAPMDIATAIMDTFGKLHRRCTLSDKGEKLQESNAKYLERSKVKFTATADQLFAMALDVTRRRCFKPITREEFDAMEHLEFGRSGSRLEVLKIPEVENGYYILRQQHTNPATLISEAGGTLLKDS